MTTKFRIRVLLILLILLGTRLVTAGRQPIVRPLLTSLSTFPLELEEWRGHDQPALDPQTMKVLGADEYVNRVYAHPAYTSVGLYVGYYGSQQQGDAIHSPQNCLPGSGWQPLSHSRTTLDASSGRVPVNRYIVEKRGDRQLVFYWFHGRGRMVASEYLNKAFLLHDAIRVGRTEGALVRLSIPMIGSEASADNVAEAFVRVLLPPLKRWLP